MLVGKKVTLEHDCPGWGPRRNVTLAEQSRGQKIWSTIKNNILNHSLDKDKYQEGTI